MTQWLMDLQKAGVFRPLWLKPKPSGKTHSQITFLLGIV